MPTPTERRIIERRRARERGGVLVSILEDALARPLELEDEEDIGFMVALLRNRMTPREPGVFSPSQLSVCTRKAYFSRTGMERRYAEAPQTNAYFLDGNFRHYKWQFALWKAHRLGLLTLIAVELRILHPNGDFAGTLDALVEIDGVLYIVDFKGMNVRDFQRFVAEGIRIGHRIQIVGYGMIARLNDISVEKAILVAESKAGPVNGSSPIALHEDIVEIKADRALVKKRMRELRSYVEKAEIPEPACVSTRHKEFQECPFAWYCREEIQSIQKAREREAHHGISRRKELRVARVSRRADQADR